MKKIFINARIKNLRKALKLSQAEFGERIGLKQGAISRVEQEGVPVTEQNIKLICEKFNVRREWLTEGKGEMLQETEDSLFASFAERYHLDPAEQMLAKYLLRLTSEERQMVKQYILSMASAMQAAPAKQEEPPFFDSPSPSLAFTAEELDAYERVKAAKEKETAAFDAETDALHRQLDMEREAEKKGASESSSGSSGTAALIGNKA